MSLSLSILSKILPLYLIIVCGFLSAKYYKINKEQIATLAIYILSPAVVFLGTVKAGLQINILLIPLVSFLIMTGLCFLNYQFGKLFWEDSTRNLFAYTSASANAGYFGIPLCLAVLGQDSLPIAVMFALGSIFFENTFGYYIFARTKYSPKDSFMKLLTLPSLYAFIIGLIINICNFKVPAPINDFFEILKGGYAPLGMMIVGLGLAGATFKHIDKKFIFLTHINKFIIWFVIMAGIIILDKNYFQFFTPMIYKVFLLLSAVPLAANSVSFSSYFKAHPEKASVTVMISNLVAFATIPIAAILMEKI